MRRFVFVAFAIAGCQQPLAVSQPTLQRPQVAAMQPRQSPARPHPYQYLQPQQPARHPWIPYGQSRGWRWIVIHHSDTATGSAASFDRYHKDVHHWDELGYHFVIGNGTGSGDGQVEVGPRWSKQKTGAHAGVKEFNEFGIGICLVGDFGATRPTSAQMQSLARLSGWLMSTYRIPPNRIIGHRDAKHTACPGRYMDLAMLRTMAGRMSSAHSGMAKLG
jgi:N-acetylmuramoyl-L-alanine amidase